MSAVAAVATLLSGTAAQALTDPTTVPVSIGEIFGARPVVEATINGKAFHLVIHANAGSYLQFNHAAATDVGARDLVHKGAYGIAAPGQVSDLGRDDGFVDELSIGDWTADNVPVAVFEVPAGGSQGMLGLPWLHKSRAILDFHRRTLTLPGDEPSDPAFGPALIRQGYSAHSMTRDETDGRYLVAVSINGAVSRMVVSTVASVDIDTAFAERAGVALGERTGSYGGPTGATGAVHDTAQPVILQIGDWSSEPDTVSVEDTYAYSNKPRPEKAEDARGGSLGADFMIRYGAVIDFGEGVLYLRSAQSPNTGGRP